MAEHAHYIDIPVGYLNEIYFLACFFHHVAALNYRPNMVICFYGQNVFSFPRKPIELGSKKETKQLPKRLKKEFSINFIIVTTFTPDHEIKPYWSQFDGLDIFVIYGYLH